MSEPHPKAPIPVRYEHTPNLADVLQGLGVSLMMSTYQAGKVLTVGVQDGAPVFSFHHFEQAMGLAPHPRRLAVGSRRQVWILNSAPELAPRIEPAGRYDSCFLTRTAHYTGNIHVHEMAWADDELWVVNTLFSCLCTLGDDYSFVPRWRPSFISELAAEDRCHLNGIAMEDHRPRFVTVMSETDTAAGWRPTKATSGCIIDVPSGEVVARGLAMPHSPRFHGKELWVLDSGHGRLSKVDLETGRAEPVAQLDGYTRGLAMYGPYAFIGLSKIRETSVFNGIPIAEHRERLRCGLAVVDVRSGKLVAGLNFHSGVDEIFDVKLLPGVRNPSLSGPLPEIDGAQTVWLVPSPKQTLEPVATPA
ncbi:TIGR03032 family protein [Tundrisphaera lichenicola]|uniref:TIGR03032 family protein n=1 Tax=Tundrisphaera lichenicola TaxID=2029860 RepID=UPI003EB88D64